MRRWLARLFGWGAEEQRARTQKEAALEALKAKYEHRLQSGEAGSDDEVEKVARCLSARARVHSDAAYAQLRGLTETANAAGSTAEAELAKRQGLRSVPKDTTSTTDR